jgi:hypothetical protein
MSYGVKEISQLFPPLMEIKDKSLREKVAAVWSEAITTAATGKAGPLPNFAQSNLRYWPATSI